MTAAGGNGGQSVYAIKLAGMLVPLRRGETLLGRASDCGIVVPSEKASRKHAKLVVDESGVYVEDLKSTNGVFVNDEQVTKQLKLRLRDTIRIGDVTMRLVHLDDMKRTRRGDPLPAGIPDEAGHAGNRGAGGMTKQASAFDVVGPLVDKMLTLGRTDEAERLLRPPMQRILEGVQSGGGAAEGVTSAAASYAVRLAEASGDAEWIDWAVKIHSLLARTLPIAVVDDLYRVLRSVRDIDRPALREYVERLEARAGEMGPTERFALKRISGLVRIASS